LLYGVESHVWAGSGYTGIDKRQEHRVRAVDWNVAMRPGSRAQLPESSATHWVERLKASVRAKVEHPFLTIKRHFGYGKVRYRGLEKNYNRLHVLAPSATC
jgi:IS5 family transposase